jgi:hypothetical protein
MLALDVYEREHCDSCGTDLAVALSTEPEDWAVPPPFRCAPCTRVAMDQNERATENEKRPGGGYMHALRYRVERRQRRR